MSARARGRAYVKLAKWGRWHPTRKGKTICGLRGRPRKTADHIGESIMCCDCTRSILVSLGSKLLARTYRTKSAIEEAAIAAVFPTPSTGPFPARAMSSIPEQRVLTRQIVIVAALATIAIVLLLAGLFG